MRRVVRACRTTTGVKASVLLRGVTYIHFGSITAKHSFSWLQDSSIKAVLCPNTASLHDKSVPEHKCSYWPPVISPAQSATSRGCGKKIVLTSNYGRIIMEGTSELRNTLWMTSRRKEVPEPCWDPIFQQDLPGAT
jgi:hypothetical protein